VILPSWLGDTAMATPSLRLLREAYPRSVIVGLGRPGMDDLLAGSDLLDDLLMADKRALLGPALVASRIKRHKFDAALILPNSFSSAMAVSLAGIPLRCGYDRDSRGMLLTHKLEPLRRAAPHKGFAPVSAVDYYLALTRFMLTVLAGGRLPDSVAAFHPVMELSTSDGQDRAATDILAAAGVATSPGARRFVLMNPGGNHPAKRWPVERFAAAAHHLISRHDCHVVINGSPGEAPIVALIRDALVLNHPEDERRVTCLTELGINIGSLKGIVRRASLMVTNDTGPRHMAAAFSVPCVTLFGPTDLRWTTLPDSCVFNPEPGSPLAREVMLVADPTLPPDEVADDHPERCRIDRIPTEAVLVAVDAMLAGRSTTAPGPGRSV
jgi:heptosyltransferase-2